MSSKDKSLEQEKTRTMAMETIMKADAFIVISVNKDGSSDFHASGSLYDRAIMTKLVERDFFQMADQHLGDR